MKTNKVIISRDTRWQLEYFDWDVKELEQELPKVFPDKDVIEVTNCEIRYLELCMDGEYYVVDETLETIEKGRM
jgi:hypothetical protein